MNKIWKLFDDQFVLDYFKANILPLYPAFTDIARVTIKPYKKLIWETTYHVVIGFNAYLVDAAGRETRISIVCAAHSDEPRENVLKALQYLWQEKFPNGIFSIPKPLFYSEDFRGTFYRALSGDNLLHYIKDNNLLKIKNNVILSAQLFARLHGLKAGPEANFNPLNSRIETVIPGKTAIFKEMSERYEGKYDEVIKSIYNYCIEQENIFFARGDRLALVHGDAHPENIIATGEGKVGLIDFADLCLADPARDIGAFLQQLEYKINTKIGDGILAKEMMDLFLENYLQAANLESTPELQERIALYYNWTAMRTAIYWFLKFEHNEERAVKLLEQVKANLKL